MQVERGLAGVDLGLGLTAYDIACIYIVPARAPA